MRKVILLIFTLVLFGSCATIKSYNNNLDKKIDVKKLKADIDFTYRRLQKLHPDLFLYTNKETLDFKFDSLKSSINSPMTSKELYFELSPVIVSINQGHTKLYPPTRKLSIGKKFDISGRGTSPLTQFKFELFDNSYYIIENNSCKQEIPIGAELLRIDNQDPIELASKYRKTIGSDGFNRTYIDRRISSGLTDFFYYQNELVDSVLMTLKYSDSTYSVLVKHKYLEIPCRDSSNDELVSDSIADPKEVRKNRRYQGYNEYSDDYSKDLEYLATDSSIAILRVRDFQDGNYSDFYEKCFKQLKSLNTQSLIIDIRDNHGGALFDAFELFKYLADSNFIFIDKAEVTSPNSLLYRTYFIVNGGSLNIMMGLLYPLELLNRAKLVSGIEETAEGKYYLPLYESYSKKSDPNRFKQDLYIIINGGTFSAASILAANIKSLDRAVFVGQETGGTQNGTVAGQMAILKLPNSRLRLRCGLMHVKPIAQSGIFGRGIMPDIELKPDLQDYIDNTDPELQWILDDIKAKSNR